MTEVSLSQVLFDIKSQHGEALGQRFDKGAGLFYAAATTYLGENEWLVDSSHPGQRYTVRFHLAWSCTCPDCTSGRAPMIEFLGGQQHTCKHIVACGLSWLIDNPEAAQRPHPQPFITVPAWLLKERAPAAEPDKYLADFGLTDKELATTPPAYTAMLDQERRRRETALPAAMTRRHNINDYLG